eukprot:scaffold16734_cov20-Cyclotella_meneghiniana.AAC.1
MAESWDDIEKYFKRTSVNIGNAHFEIYFLNQVAGPVFHNGKRSDTVNEIDGAVQCSTLGVDLFSPQIPLCRDIRDCNFARPLLFVSKDEDFFYTENGKKISTMRYNSKRVEHSRNCSYVNRFVRFKNAVFNWDSGVNYHTMSHIDGKPLSLQDMTEVDKSIDGMFLVPSPLCSLRFEQWVKFYVISKKSLATIKKKHHKRRTVTAVTDLENDLKEVSTTTVEYFVLNTRGQELCNAVVYAGSSAPAEVTYTQTNDEDGWDYYLDPTHDIVQRQLLDGGGKFETHPPVSISYKSQFTQS